jgi:RNA polymerase sigma-70 factor (ECF subfamily)
MVEGVTEAELVRRIARRDGEREAEAELCRRFAPRIRLYGLRHLRTEDGAADLVQAVLLGVLQAAREGRIAEPEHVERFVLGTCRHIAGRARQRAARLMPAESTELDVAVTLPDVERIESAALMRCLSKLDVRARTVLLLSFQAESAADEIAAHLAISVANVRVVRHRALASLRSCLDGAERASA